MSQPFSQSAEKLDGAPEESQKAECRDIFPNRAGERRELSPGLVAVVALTQGQMSKFWLQN